MMFKAPSVISVSFLNLEIKFYGIMMFFAMLIALGAIYLISKKYYSKKIERNFLLDLFPIVIVGGILGARIYYVLLSFDYFSSHLSEIFAIWHGGLSIHGAIFGGLIAGISYCKIHKKQILPYADVIAYGLVLGQAVGRWGNFFNSEAYGAPTNLPWKLFIEPQFRPIQFLNLQFFHPTFLYESILDVLIFFTLFFIVRKIAKNKSGVVFFAYLILYSIARFFVEEIRVDSILNLNSIPIAQIISVILALTGIFGLFWVYLKGKDDN